MRMAAADFYMGSMEKHALSSHAAVQSKQGEQTGPALLNPFANTISLVWREICLALATAYAHLAASPTRRASRARAARSSFCLLAFNAARCSASRRAYARRHMYCGHSLLRAQSTGTTIKGLMHTFMAEDTVSIRCHSLRSLACRS